MTLHGAWNNQQNSKQLGESLLILSPDRTVGLMVMTDSFGSWSDDELDEISSYFALQGFVNVVAPVLGSSDRRSHEEYAALLRNGMLQANAVTYFATKAKVAGAYTGTILTAVLIVDSTLYGVHEGTNRVYIKSGERELYQVTRDHKFWNWGKEKQHRPGGLLFDGHIGVEPGQEQFDAFQLQGRWESVVLCSHSVWQDVPEGELASYLEQPLVKPDIRKPGTPVSLYYEPLNLQHLCNQLIAAAQRGNDHPNRRRTDKILALGRKREGASTDTPLCHIPRFIKLPASVEPLYPEVVAKRDNRKATAMFYETFEGIGRYFERRGQHQQAREYRQWLADH
jgi:serine/threonine protein phosphatase PrpC